MRLPNEPRTPLTSDQIANRFEVAGMTEIRRLIKNGRIQKHLLLEAIQKIPREKILERDQLTQMAKAMP